MKTDVRRTRGKIHPVDFRIPTCHPEAGFHLYHTLPDSADTEKRQVAALDRLLTAYQRRSAENPTE